MADPVVPSEYVAHVRAVTAELRELIPTVAEVAGRAARCAMPTCSTP